MELQGYQVARWLNERGIAAFVLKYRLVPTPKETSQFLELITRESGTALEGVISAKDASDGQMAACQDGLDAVAYIRSHATQWHLRPDRIGLLGFSSGAFTMIIRYPPFRAL
jgi:dienelactone hydrolase